MRRRFFSCVTVPTSKKENDSIVNEKNIGSEIQNRLKSTKINKMETHFNKYYIFQVSRGNRVFDKNMNYKFVSR